MSFFKRESYTDFVDLSIGRVYIRALNNGMINRVSARSTIYGSILNNAVYFNEMEKELVVLKPKQMDNLSVKDGEKLRSKIQEVLHRHGLIDEPKKEEFSKSEIDQFKTQEKELMERLRKKNA